MPTEPCVQITPDTRPRQRDRIDEHGIEDEAVLYDVAHHATHYVNATARFIWSKCDGRHTVEDIANCVLETFDPNDGNDPSAIRRDVNATVTALARNGLVNIAAEGI